jgi:AraC family transcriptional regulator
MTSQTAGAYQQRVIRAVTHIEEHLDQALALGTLARHSGLTDWHFHRMFRQLVGEPPHAYVQRLRLERAAFRLKRTEQRITTLALEAGYQAHEAFSRAFKSMFGQAPLQFRQDGWALGSRACAPRVIILPARRIAFIRHFGPYERAPVVLGQLRAWAQSQGLPNTGVVWGVPWDHRAITAPERLRYDAAMPIEPGLQVAGAVGTRLLRAGSYINVQHRGPYDALNATYEYVYGTWMSAKGYSPANSPPFEIYHQDAPGQTSPRTDIYIPVIRTRPDL